jgi:predicted dehydrogenase
MLHRPRLAIIFTSAWLCLNCLAGLAATPLQAQAGAPIRVAVVGLVHDHALGIFSSLAHNANVQLVGIAEPDQALVARYQSRFHLDPKLFFPDTAVMLDQLHPAAVLVYTSIQDHRKVIEAAASRGISSMVEKPLATTMADALAIRAASRQHHVQVLVNYETTWYASNEETRLQADAGKLGPIRRVVVHDGHQGPKEIGVSPDFLRWLTDPEKNGAGAIFDFGCYGADLMTRLMHGETPLSVTAVALTDKPDIYPKVEDDATIIVRYPKAQLVLEPSWNWPFGRKDMEIYGATGYAITVAAGQLRIRYAGDKTEAVLDAPPLTGSRQNSLDYLAAVLRGQLQPGTGPEADLSSLDTNMIVMQILTAARESAQSHRTVDLKPLPK